MLEGGKLLLLTSEPGFAATVCLRQCEWQSVRGRAGEADAIYTFSPMTLHFGVFPHFTTG